MKATKLLLLLGAGLTQIGCASSVLGAGCVAYFASDFTVDPDHDTVETVDGFAVLEARMVEACD